MSGYAKSKVTQPSQGAVAAIADAETAPVENAEPDAEMSAKQYAKALKKLHVELVKLQLWVAHTGAKICIVFEGRDGAGKGGTIKAITERVSPRVFRVIALPAPTEREKSQMYMQALPATPARRRRGRHLRQKLVQPRRRRAGHGFLHAAADRALPEDRSADGESHRPNRESSCSSTGWK
jgi:hypothetical protein